METIAFIGGVGAPEVIIVLVIALIVFGPKRLPDLGRSLGSGMRNFKESVTGGDDDDRPARIASEHAEVETVDAPAREREPAAPEAQR